MQGNGASSPAAAGSASGQSSGELFTPKKLANWCPETTTSKRIKHCHINGGTKIVVLHNDEVVRTRYGQSPELVKIPPKMEKSIQHVFVDPTGKHVLLATQKQIAYLSSDHSTAKFLFDEIQLSSMAWDPRPQGASQGHCLVGTVKGEVYELELGKKSCEKLGDLAQTPNQAITSMDAQPCISPEGEPLYFILAAVSYPTAMYAFVGGPTMRDAFENYKGGDQGPTFLAAPEDQVPPTICSYYRNANVPNIGSLANENINESELLKPVPRVGNVRAAEDITVICTVGLLVAHLATELTASDELWYPTTEDKDQTRCDPYKVITKKLHIPYPKSMDDTSAVDETFEYMAEVRSSKLSEGSDEDADENRKGGNSRPQQLHVGTNDSSHLPLSVAITDYHYLMLFHDRIIGVSRFSKKPVYERLSKHALRGLVADYHDPQGTVVYYYDETDIYSLSLRNESRDAWQYILNKATHEKESCSTLFNLAAKLANRTQRERVYKVQADWHVSQGEMTKAAELYAKTDYKFEEICLLFIEEDERDALMRYVELRLDGLDSKRHKTQRMMLAVWLTELYLDKLNSASAQKNASVDVLKQPKKGSRGKAEQPQDAHKVDLKTSSSHQFTTAESEGKVKGDFELFLEENTDILHKETVMDLMSSHGRTDMMLFFAELCKDYSRMVTHYMQTGNYAKVIDLLHEADPDTALPLIYKYSTVLILQLPEKTVHLWESLHRRIDPTKLLPAITKYSRLRSVAKAAKRVKGANVLSESDRTFGLSHVHKDVWTKLDQATAYVKRLIDKGNEQPAMHNCLLSLYARNGEEEELLHFLNRQSGNSRRIDFKYALLVCSNYEMTKACVRIYNIMGMHEQAVREALKLSAGDAQKEAQVVDPNQQPALAKHLRMLIATHLVGQRKIQEAIQFTESCRPTISIEDILPYLPDDTVIDHFKENIIDALKRCGNKIETLRNKMKSSSQSAKVIQDDIYALSYRYGVVHGNQICPLSGKRVVEGPFYMFPSGNTYREEALCEFVRLCITSLNGSLPFIMCSTQMLRWFQDKKLQEIIVYLRDKVHQQREYLDRQNSTTGRVASVGNKMEKGDSGAASRLQTQVKRLQEKLDMIVANDDPLCGEPMIQSIDKPFGKAPGEVDRFADWES
eukprot:gb/GECG01015964.1/.p1 GENE.gb/GECG01015964.1/~~gb/GECG01015964.1/.p1  ORF type:complete len:1144 (+),score=132.33 gb/GECG01015964.1/:1-3432(+)